MKPIALFALSAALAAAGPGGTLMADDVIVNPHLTTDRSVDTWSVKTMVAGLVQPDMTDQDKALAVYNYIRRTMFHYRYLTRYAGGGTMDLINGVGYCLCTPTAGTQARLTSEAGVSAHVLNTPGHGSVVVFIDGKWRWLDAFMGGAVWDRDRTALATLEEIVADPSLLRREDPSPAPLFSCGAVLYDDALRWEPDNEKYHQECGPDDFAWTARATPGKHQPMIWDDMTSLAITLRPGERYSRQWDHVPGMFFLFRTGEQFAPPHHICGVEAEIRDTVNWPYFKPYVKEITSTDARTGKVRTVRTGRYWANGQLTWSPKLDAPEPLRHFARTENAKVDGAAIVAADPSRPAVLQWRVDCPFMLQGGTVRYDAVAGKGVVLSIAVDPSRGDRASATPKAGEFQRIEPAPGDVAGLVELRPHFAANIGTRGYTLRIELTEPDSRLAGLVVDTIFQHNMYALPQLMPGRNEVRVVLANPDALGQAKFVVEYAWDLPDGTPRVERHAIDRSPFTFTVDVPGPDLPRMRRLVLANEG